MEPSCKWPQGFLSYSSEKVLEWPLNSFRIDKDRSAHQLQKPTSNWGNPFLQRPQCCHLNIYLYIYLKYFLYISPFLHEWYEIIHDFDSDFSVFWWGQAYFCYVYNPCFLWKELSIWILCPFAFMVIFILHWFLSILNNNIPDTYYFRYIWADNIFSQSGLSFNFVYGVLYVW